MKPNQENNPFESVRKAVKKRKDALTNIWIFQSPKNDKRLTIKGDIAFMYCILWEGDPAVKAYELDPPFHITDPDRTNKPPIVNAVRYLVNGATEWCLFRGEAEKKSSLLIVEVAAARVSATCKVFTAAQLSTQKILFDNWLNLCAAMTRAKCQTNYTEGRILARRLLQHQQVTLATLLNEEGIDPCVMLGLVARGLAQGSFSTDLDARLFSLSSVLERSPA